jgi:RNA polymerase sigma factor (sigma-70 family)
MESDRRLMGRMADGDAEAFDTLMARHADSLRRRLAAITRDEAAAEDLAQEVFLRLWTRAEQWNGQGSVAAWLGRIATNLALNHLRTRRRHPAHSLDGRLDDEPDRAAEPDWMIDARGLDPVDLLERAEQLDRLRAAVDHLPEAKRAVVRLVHEQELDVREAARQLGIPEGTARSRLHYSIRRLARELGEAD